jgi:uncharacterized lipoprotein YmbA
MLLGAVCLLTGCLARPPLEQQSFIFAAPAASAAKASPGGRVLRIRSLQVAAPFEGRQFVYRTGEFSYDNDTYAQFMVPPAEGLVPPINSLTRQSGVFSAVAEPGSGLKPDTLVEIHVTQLYGDFRPSREAAAVLAMRFLFFDAPQGIPGKVLFQQEYARALPLKTRSAAALIEGWNQALDQILQAAMSDFGRLDSSALKKGS